MALYKGSNKICDLYYHGVAVAEIYKGNILVWTKAAAEYLVTVSQAANGTITAAPMQGPAGTLVTLSNTPNAGYQLTYYTVNGNQIQGNTFTLSSDSTISGLFTAVTYTVTIGAHANGSLSANPMSGVYGTTVTLTGTPNTHYELDYYSVNGSQISGNTFTLTQDSTVAATFKQKTYTVTIGTHTNGTLSASPASGVYGTTITLSGTPNSGYTLDYYTVGGSRITGNTFTLTGNTTVTAVYKQQVQLYWLSYLNGHSGNNFTTTVNEWNMYLTGEYINDRWDTQIAKYQGTSASTIHTLTTSDINGTMPTSYVGKQYIELQCGCDLLQSTYIPTTVKQWTVGFWFRNNDPYQSSSSANNSKNLPCNLACTTRKWNKIGIRFKSNDRSMTFPTTTYSSSVFAAANSFTWTSSTWWLKSSFGNTWSYCCVCFDEDAKTIKYYINGTLSLTVNTKKWSSYFTDTGSSSMRYTVLKMYPKSISTNNYNLGERAQTAICELAIYKGIVTTAPTSPLR